MVNHHQVAVNAQRTGKNAPAVIGGGHFGAGQRGQVEAQMILVVDFLSLVDVGAVIGISGACGGTRQANECPAPQHARFGLAAQFQQGSGVGGPDIAVDGDEAFQRIGRIRGQIRQGLADFEQKCVGDVDIVIAELTVDGTYHKTACRHVARQILSCDFGGILGRRLLVRERKKADVAVVRLPVALKEQIAYAYAAVSDILIDGVKDHARTAPADIGGQGFDRNTRRLRIHAHGPDLRPCVALSEPGQGSVGGFDFQVESPFADAGIF